MVQKTDSEVDSIMASIPEEFRYRWCGGWRGPCACMGCVQVFSRVPMIEEATGQKYFGDPEYICENSIPVDIQERYKISRQEWVQWKARNPQEELK